MTYSIGDPGETPTPMMVERDAIVEALVTGIPAEESAAVPEERG